MEVAEAAAAPVRAQAQALVRAVVVQAPVQWEPVVHKGVGLARKAADPADQVDPAHKGADQVDPAVQARKGVAVLREAPRTVLSPELEDSKPVSFFARC